MCQEGACVGDAFNSADQIDVFLVCNAERIQEVFWNSGGAAEAGASEIEYVLTIRRNERAFHVGRLCALHHGPLPSHKLYSPVLIEFGEPVERVRGYDLWHFGCCGRFDWRRRFANGISHVDVVL